MRFFAWLFIAAGWYNWWVEAPIEVTATMFIIASVYAVGGYIISELRR